MNKHNSEMIVPDSAKWFSYDAISSFEIECIPGYFKGDSEKTAIKYKRYRNFLLDLYWRDPSLKLNFKYCCSALSIDKADLIWIYTFLDQWGLINNESKLRDVSKVAASEEHPNKKRKIELTRKGPQIRGFVKHHCNKNVNANETKQEKFKNYWSDAELLRLQRAIELYSGDWKKISDYVITKTDKECMIEYLKNISKCIPSVLNSNSVQKVILETVDNITREINVSENSTIEKSESDNKSNIKSIETCEINDKVLITSLLSKAIIYEPESDIDDCTDSRDSDSFSLVIDEDNTNNIMEWRSLCIGAEVEVSTEDGKIVDQTLHNVEEESSTLVLPNAKGAQHDETPIVTMKQSNLEKFLNHLLDRFVQECSRKIEWDMQCLSKLHTMLVEDAIKIEYQKQDLLLKERNIENIRREFIRRTGNVVYYIENALDYNDNVTEYAD